MAGLHPSGNGMAPCVAAALLALVVWAASSGAGDASSAAVGPSVSSPCGLRSRPPARFAHVIWIWMENHSYGEVVGSASSRYVDKLARECGLATNYDAISHPSLPNYIAATSGSTWGITNDDAPTSHRLAVMSIFKQASTARSFEESMPSNCDRSDSGRYAVRHDPETYYVDVGSACRTQAVPLGTTTRGALEHALETETLPAFSFVTPNICNDTHDCSVQTGDRWLARWVSTITMSSTYRAGRTALFITWDENDGAAGNDVAAIVVSPYTMPGTRSAMPFSHYSLLLTTEELLGIRRHLGYAARARSMRPVFGL